MSDSTRPRYEPPAIVRLLVERAELLASCGRRDESRALLLSAIAVDPTPSARIAFAVFQAVEDPVSAIADLEGAWADACRLGSPKYRAICCSNLAALWRQQGNDDLAANYEQHAITAEMESEEFQISAQLSAEVMISIAARWSSIDEVDAARRMLSASECVTRDQSDQATIASHLGVIAASDGQLLEAARQFLRAERIYRQARDLTGAAHTLMNLGHVFQQQRRFIESRRSFQHASDLFESIGAESLAAIARGFEREVTTFDRLEKSDPQWN